MSAIRHQSGGLTISTYAGGARALERSPHTASQTCVQIGADGEYVRLTMDQWVDLVCFIRSLDARSIGITATPEID